MNARAKNPAALGAVAAMITPVLGIVAFITSAINRRHPSWLGFAASLSLIYSYLPLLWDARNNFFLIYVFRDIEFNLYTKSIDFMVNELGVQYIFSLFLFGMITVYVVAKVIGSSLIIRYQAKSVHLLMGLLLLLMCVEYRAIFDLQRTSLSLAILILAIHVPDIRLKLVLGVVSALVHPMSLAVAILFPLARIVQEMSPRAWMAVFISGVLVAIWATPERLAGMVAGVDFIPDRVYVYLSSEESRFSTETIANFVWALRASACIVVSICCLRHISKSHEPREKWLVGILVLQCLMTLCISRTEILSERYFMATVMISAYVASQVRFNATPLVFITFSLLSNVLVHGVYTLQLTMSDAYNVIMTSPERREMSAKGFYYPTVLLLNYNEFGYSDQMIMNRAYIR